MAQHNDAVTQGNSNRPRLCGRALVCLESGHNYYADLQIVDGLVHATRVESRIADVLQGRADRAWPPAAIREIRWEGTAG